MKRFRKLIVTGLGTGYLPVAPGTWGSAAVAGVLLLAAWGSGGRWYCVSGTMAIVGVLAAAACVGLGRFAEQAFGRKDPSEVTIDEWAGQAVAYMFLPLGAGPRGWLIAAAAGFVAFRVLDIVKLPPARRLEKLPGGWGILMDDLAAGLYANIICQVVLRLWLSG